MTAAAGRERVGLLGGTFNPVHSGHIFAAEAVADRFGLDTILLIPSYRPPHKEPPDLAPAADRLRMIELACAGHPRLVPSDIEVRARGRSYSVVTLDKVRRLYPGAWVFFLLGVDAFLEIETWKDYRKVLEQCLFIVMSRPGSDLGAARSVLGGRLAGRTRLVGPGERPGESELAAERVFLAPIDALDISSTDIRRRLRRGLSVAGLVPPAVAEYLERHRLYKETMAERNKTVPSSPAAGKRALPREIRLAVKAAQDKKAEEVFVLDLRPLSAFTDYFVILHGQSARQNAAIAENIEAELKKAGRRPLGVEGRAAAEWILVDYGDFVVHVFSPEKRAFYGLEKLWGDAIKYSF
jgi:nicotinate-nucleotide adenylyltransferase